MKRDLEDFIHERAERLAIVYLTRCPNLSIERMSNDYGLNFLVTLLRDQLPTGRVFGIHVKGRDRAFKKIEQEAVLPVSLKDNHYFQELPFPVCLLFFSMEDDRGYYRWLKYSSRSNSNSDAVEQEQWHSLDDCQMNQILEEVDAWYDEKRRSAA